MIITDVVAQPAKSLAQSVEPGQTVYSVRLNPPDARSLGLREGQIVNAVIENRADGNILLLDKKLALKLPFQFALSSELAAKLRMDSISQGVLSLLVAKKPETTERLSLVNSRFARLLSKGSGLNSLENLFRLGPLESEGVRDLKTSLGQLSLQSNWFKGYDHRILYSTLQSSGLFHEKALIDGRSVPNLKETLLKLLKNSKLTGPESALIFSAIDDIEASQIESLAHQLARTTQYHWLIPVLGDWPIELQFFSEGDEGNAEDAEMVYRWKIVMKLKINENESIDLSALFTEREVLSLYVAVPTDELMYTAEQKKGWLLSELKKLGVKIDELRVFQKVPSTISNVDYGVSAAGKSWIADA